MNTEIFAQFGIAGAMLFLLSIILQWIMKLHDKVLDSSSKERNEWKSVIGALTDRIEAGSRSQILFMEQILEMGQRDRSEHELIIKHLEEYKSNIK